MTASIEGERAPIPRESARDLLDRIEGAWGALRGARAVLAFDADGTLWDGDVGTELFEALLAERGVRPEVEAALRREAAEFGVAAEGSAHEVATALYAAFFAATYPEDRAFAMMAWCFGGWLEGEVRAFADRVLAARGLDARLRPSLRPIVDWAHSRGVDVFVVSASPQVVVERGVTRLGIAPERVLAMRPSLRDGRLAPELSAPPTYGDGKILALQRATSSRPVLAAFGDSAYDAPMLRIARIPVAVAPSPKLAALAPTIPGLVEIAL
jgi:HAD superfamily phosphoserine phosphatase-like hydrolase